MVEEKYSDEDLRNLIDNEGLGYAIYGYLNPSMVENETTKALWLDAYNALKALSEHLELD